MGKSKHKRLVTGPPPDERSTPMPLKATDIIYGRPLPTIPGYKKFTLPALPTHLVYSGPIPQTGPYDALAKASVFFSNRDLLLDLKHIDIKGLLSIKCRKDDDAFTSDNILILGGDGIPQSSNISPPARATHFTQFSLPSQIESHDELSGMPTFEQEEDPVPDIIENSTARAWSSAEIVELLYQDCGAVALRRPRARSISGMEQNKGLISRSSSLPRSFNPKNYTRDIFSEANITPTSSDFNDKSSTDADDTVSYSSGLSPLDQLKDVLNIGCSGSSPPLSFTMASPTASDRDSTNDDSNAGGKLLMSILGIKQDTTEDANILSNEATLQGDNDAKPFDNSAGEYLMSILRNGPASRAPEEDGSMGPCHITPDHEAVAADKSTSEYLMSILRSGPTSYTSEPAHEDEPAVPSSDAQDSGAPAADNSVGEYHMSILRNGPMSCTSRPVHQYNPEVPCFVPATSHAPHVDKSAGEYLMSLLHNDSTNCTPQPVHHYNPEASCFTPSERKTPLSDNSAGEYLMSILRAGPTSCKTQSTYHYNLEAPCFNPQGQCKTPNERLQAQPALHLNVHAEQFMPHTPKPASTDPTGIHKYAKMQTTSQQNRISDVQSDSQKMSENPVGSGGLDLIDAAGPRSAQDQALVDMFVLPGALLSDETFLETMQSGRISPSVFAGFSLSNALFLLAMHCEAVKSSIFPGFRLMDDAFRETMHSKHQTEGLQNTSLTAKSLESALIQSVSSQKVYDGTIALYSRDPVPQISSLTDHGPCEIFLNAPAAPYNPAKADGSNDVSIESDRWADWDEDKSHPDGGVVDREPGTKFQLPAGSIMQCKYFMRESHERPMFSEILRQSVKKFSGSHETGFGPSHSQLELEKTIPTTAQPLVYDMQRLPTAVEHHMNSFRDIVPHKSSTAPETSLAIILSAPKPDVCHAVLQGDSAGSLQRYVRLWNSWQYVDPVIFSGDHNEFNTLERAHLREEAGRNRTMRFYTPWGDWQVTDPRDAAVDNLDTTGQSALNYTVYNGSEWFDNQPTRASIDAAIFEAYTDLENRKRSAARHHAQSPQKMLAPSPLSSSTNPQLLLTQGEAESNAHDSESEKDEEFQPEQPSTGEELPLPHNDSCDVKSTEYSKDKASPELSVHSEDSNDGDDENSLTSGEDSLQSLEEGTLCPGEWETSPPTSVEGFPASDSPKQKRKPYPPQPNLELEAIESDESALKVQKSDTDCEQEPIRRVTVQKYFDAENKVTGLLFGKQKSAVAPSFTVFNGADSPLVARAFSSPPAVYGLAKVSRAAFQTKSTDVQHKKKLTEIAEREEVEDKDLRDLSRAPLKLIDRLNQEFRALNGLPEPGTKSIREEYGQGENTVPTMPKTPVTLRKHRQLRATIAKMSPIADAGDEMDDASGTSSTSMGSEQLTKSNVDHDHAGEEIKDLLPEISREDESSNIPSLRAPSGDWNGDVKHYSQHGSALVNAPPASSTRLPSALGLRASPPCSAAASIHSGSSSHASGQIDRNTTTMPGTYPPSTSSEEDPNSKMDPFHSLRRTIRGIRPFTTLSRSSSSSSHSKATPSVRENPSESDGHTTKTTPDSHNASESAPTRKQAQTKHKKPGFWRNMYNKLTKKQ